MAAKQEVRRLDPKARLDYYETLRGANMPCWFIRHGMQGDVYTPICSSPRAAWRSAFEIMTSTKERAR